MKCPKCEEGVLAKITFKRDGRKADLCNFCDALWFANERIAVTTGHSLRAYVQGEEDEYEINEKEDQDHQDIKPVRYF